MKHPIDARSPPLKAQALWAWDPAEPADTSSTRFPPARYSAAVAPDPIIEIDPIVIVFISCVVIGATWLLARMWAAFRPTASSSEPRCTNCGYLMQGWHGSNCPECGFDDRLAKRPSRPRCAMTSALLIATVISLLPWMIWFYPEHVQNHQILRERRSGRIWFEPCSSMIGKPFKVEFAVIADHPTETKAAQWQVKVTVRSVGGDQDAVEFSSPMWEEAVPSLRQMIAERTDHGSPDYVAHLILSRLSAESFIIDWDWAEDLRDWKVSPLSRSERWEGLLLRHFLIALFLFLCPVVVLFLAIRKLTRRKPHGRAELS